MTGVLLAIHSTSNFLRLSSEKAGCRTGIDNLCMVGFGGICPCNKCC